MEGNPQPRDVFVDTLLTNVSIAYDVEMQGQVAGSVFPAVPVQKQSASFLTFPRHYFLRDEMQPRGLGKEPERASGFETTPQSYDCIEWGLSDVIDDRTLTNSTGVYDVRRQKTRNLTMRAVIRRERDWAEKFFKPGVWGTQLTGSATGSGADEFIQFDQAASDPLVWFDERMDAFELRTGYRPNVAVMGSKVYRTLKHHPEIIDRIKNTERGVLTRELIQTLLELDRVVVARSVWSAGKEGELPAIQYVMPQNDMLLAYAPQDAGLEVPSAGYRFVWTGLIPGSVDANGAYGGRIDRARLGTAYSDWMAIRMAFDQKKVADDLAEFYQGAVAV